MPDKLAALLRETNGADGEHGAGLVWRVQRIATDNLTFRRDTDFGGPYMPFDSLLFFAEPVT